MLSSFHAGLLMGGLTGAVAGFILALTIAHLLEWWRFHPRRRVDDPTIERLRKLR